MTLAATLVSAGALMASGAIAQEKTYEGVDDLPQMRFTVHESYGAGTTTGAATQAFADYVKAASKGKMELEIYWSGSLMSAAEVADGVASGLADMGLVFPIYNPASFPVANWLIPMAAEAGGGIPYGVQVFNAAQAEFVASSPLLVQEFEERGLHVMAAQGGAAFDLMCTTPVHNLAEAKGKRTRAAGVAFSKEVESIGMIAVPLIPAEMYEAFQRGIIDCITLHPAGYQDFGIMDVSGKDKYYINLDFSGWNSSYYSVNKAKWDALPPVAQQILLDGYMQSWKKQFEINIDRHVSFNKFFADGVVKGVQPEQEVIDALKAHQQAEIANLVNTAPPSVPDPAAVVARYQSLLAKWHGIVENDLKVAKGATTVEGRVAGWLEPVDWTPYFDRLSEELAAASQTSAAK